MVESIIVPFFRIRPRSLRVFTTTAKNCSRMWFLISRCSRNSRLCCFHYSIYFFCFSLYSLLQPFAPSFQARFIFKSLAKNYSICSVKVGLRLLASCHKNSTKVQQCGVKKCTSQNHDAIYRWLHLLYTIYRYIQCFNKHPFIISGPRGRWFESSHSDPKKTWQGCNSSFGGSFFVRFG